MIPSPLWKERAEAGKENKRVLSFLKEFRPTTCFWPKRPMPFGHKQVVGRSKQVMG